MIDPFIIRVTEHDGYLFAQINPRLEFRTKEIVGVQTKVLDYEGPYSIVNSESMDGLIAQIPNLITNYLKNK